MKKIFILFFLSFLSTSVSVSQNSTDIRIISENQYSLVLEYAPTIQTEQVIGKQQTKFTLFRFFGSQVEFDSAGWACFYRSFPIPLSSSDCSIQVTEGNSRSVDSIRLIPKPRIDKIDDFGIEEVYDETTYSLLSGAPRQKSVAELIPVGKQAWATWEI